jgi:hypothetical protein
VAESGSYDQNPLLAEPHRGGTNFDSDMNTSIAIPGYRYPEGTLTQRSTVQPFPGAAAND